jgi:DNA replication protein DnaC
MRSGIDEPTEVSKLDVEQVMARARQRRSPEERLELVRPLGTALGSSTGRDRFVLESRLNQAAVPEKYRSGDWEECSGADALRPWCADITRRVTAGRGWILSGPVGTGKSTAAGLIATEAAKAGLSVRWEYVPTMLDDMEMRDTRRSVFGRQRSVDLLIWDDFGVAQLQQWQIPLIDRIVEHRYAAMKAMIVTTNVQLALMRDDPAISRFVDRWRERMQGLEMGGQSRRRPT